MYIFSVFTHALTKQIRLGIVFSKCKKRAQVPVGMEFYCSNRENTASMETVSAVLSLSTDTTSSVVNVADRLALGMVVFLFRFNNLC